MNFFDYIKNESFFKPLTYKYRRIYYDCIRILIDRSKELPVLYESDAKDSITLYLKNEEIQRLIEEADDENEAVQLQAAEILVIFRECGWIKPRQIGRSGEYVVNLSTDCRRMMDFLDKLTEKKNEGTMSNRILSMYEIMKSASEEGSVRKERPYSNILVPMRENETELRNELADLKDSISDIMKTVIEFQDMNSFGQFIMKNEMLDRFFSEYFFVKNNGLIPTQLSFIRDRISELRYGDMYEKMIEECGKRLRCPKEQAVSRVDRYMAELQYFLSVEYEENMELIDNRINSYYNLANTRIMQMASSRVKMENLLGDFLDRVSRLSKEKQDEAMERVERCTRVINQKYVGYKSFEQNRRIRSEGQNIALNAKVMSEEEMQKRTENLFRSAPNHYAPARVGEYLDETLGTDASMELKEKGVQTKEEALMIAAAMLYAKNAEFPYEVRIEDEKVSTRIADISNVVISRK